jgi:hypothetical protein
MVVDMAMVMVVELDFRFCFPSLALAGDLGVYLVS